MAIAALILSVIAILVAGASAWYTRKQAVSAEGSQKIDASRRHDELRPNFIGEHVSASNMRDKQRPGVKLTNHGPLDLDHVDVEAVPAHRTNEAVIVGIYDHRTGETAPSERTGSLRRGESWTLAVIPAQYEADGRRIDRSGTVKFRCTSHATGYKPWVDIVAVDFPTPPWAAWR